VAASVGGRVQGAAEHGHRVEEVGADKALVVAQGPSPRVARDSELVLVASTPSSVQVRFDVAQHRPDLSSRISGTASMTNRSLGQRSAVSRQGEGCERRGGRAGAVPRRWRHRASLGPQRRVRLRRTSAAARAQGSGIRFDEGDGYAGRQRRVDDARPHRAAADDTDRAPGPARRRGQRRQRQRGRHRAQERRWTQPSAAPSGLAAGVCITVTTGPDGGCGPWATNLTVRSVQLCRVPEPVSTPWPAPEWFRPHRPTGLSTRR
jgi:hypothetical protein